MFFTLVCPSNHSHWTDDEITVALTYNVCDVTPIVMRVKKTYNVQQLSVEQFWKISEKLVRWSSHQCTSSLFNSKSWTRSVVVVGGGGGVWQQREVWRHRLLIPHFTLILHYAVQGLWENSFCLFVCPWVPLSFQALFLTWKTVAVAAFHTDDWNNGWRFMTSSQKNESMVSVT